MGIGPEDHVKLIGTLLIVLGVVVLAIGGIRYTDRDTVLDAGPVEITTTKNRSIPLSPIVGFGAIAGGVALVVAGARTRSRL